MINDIVMVLIAVLGPSFCLALLCSIVVGMYRWIKDTKARRSKDYIPTVKKDGYILTESHDRTKVRR